MAYQIEDAKRLVVEAGKKLVETGLIARTWGNVSARISDTQFVITPSGRAYETLTPEEVVVVNIDDCSHEGEIKPSSEKGIHADSYKHHPLVNFVIHTHQVNASIISPTGISIKDVYDEFRPLLGDFIPCADYGMPSTGKLRKGVEQAIQMNPRAKAIILKHHGALCMGENYEEAFDVASALEKCCERVIKENYLKRAWVDKYDDTAMRNYYLKQMKSPEMPDGIGDFGSSIRSKSSFTITVCGDSVDVDLETGLGINGIAPKVAKIHKAIYETTDCTCISHDTNPDVVCVSCTGETLYPMLDDLAQIAGVDIKCEPWIDGDTDACSKGIAKAIKGRNAVMIEGNGALVTGNSQDDIRCVKLVLAKGFATEIGANLFCRAQYIKPFECLLMRTIYVKKYSKQKDEK